MTISMISTPADCALCHRRPCMPISDRHEGNRRTRAGLTCALAVAALGSAAPASVAQGRPDLVAQAVRAHAAPYAPGDLIVQFKSGVDSAASAGLLERAGATLRRELLPSLRRSDGKGDLDLMRLPPALSVEAALQIFGADATVDFAEPNWLYTSDGVAADPPAGGEPETQRVDSYYASGDLWNMYGAHTPLFQNVYGSGAGEAWSSGGNGCDSAVIVGIVDWGVMIEHPDLAPNIWTNPYDAADGADNDDNGYADDLHGWNFVDNDNTVFAGIADGHGTHVAGIIGAAGGNGIGVIGMCPQVQMINAKFIGADGLGKASDAILAIDYLTDLKLRHHLRMPAINNSWGGFGYSQAMRDAITRAGKADILFVAVAGNLASDNDTTPFYPSSYPNKNIIAVAALNRDGVIGSFSNYGRVTVDLAAPGIKIWSTVPLSTIDGGVTYGYAAHTGTSMATPHVTGAAALYAASHPAATGAQIKAAILAAAIPTPSLKGKTVTEGRLDVSGF
jgi:subtilisin family serine protease